MVGWLIANVVLMLAIGAMVITPLAWAIKADRRAIRASEQEAATRRRAHLSPPSCEPRSSAVTSNRQPDPAVRSAHVQIHRQRKIPQGNPHPCGRRERASHHRHRPAAQARVRALRAQLFAAADELEQLAKRLLDPGPLAARGLAQVSLLMSDGRSPVYWHRAPEDVQTLAARVLEELDPAFQW
jgi:hypothetical protein